MLGPCGIGDYQGHTQWHWESLGLPWKSTEAHRAGKGTGSVQTRCELPPKNAFPAPTAHILYSFQGCCYLKSALLQCFNKPES